jgi:hypothetical protein
VHPGDGGLAHPHRLSDLLIPPAWALGILAGFEQDASVSDRVGRGGASCYKLLQLFSLGFGQDNGIPFLHNARSYPLQSNLIHPLGLTVLDFSKLRLQGPSNAL